MNLSPTVINTIQWFSIPVIVATIAWIMWRGVAFYHDVTKTIEDNDAH
jgi:hypothetical protein